MEQPAYNTAVVRRFYEEALNRRDLALVDAVVGPNVQVHVQSAPATGWNRDRLKHLLMMQWQQMPDHRYTILDLIARGDRVA
jgi:predicted ester cyclase